MANINEILARAAALRDETALNSISPERAGSIMYDTLMSLNELWLQQGAALVISKIYASVDAMEADTNPVSDISGKPLRPGQIVVIASEDEDNGSVYRYNGTDSPSWSLVGNIGNLEPVDSLDSDSTQLPLAAHQGKVLDDKISQLGQYVDDNDYIRVVTDEDGKILYGVKKTDGGFIFGAGIPPQIKEAEDGKVDKEEGKSLINDDYASAQDVIEDSEYLSLALDEDGAILEGTTKEGTKEINVPIKANYVSVKNADIKNASIDSIDLSEQAINTLKEALEIGADVSLPDYYFEDDYITDKVAKINDLWLNTGAYADLFLFFTDAHYYANFLKTAPLIEYILKNSCVRKSFYGGDTAHNTGYDTVEDVSWENRVAKTIIPYSKYLPVRGNHDYYNNNKLYPYTAVRNNLFNLCNVEKIVIDDRTIAVYYYFDEDFSKIRYIVLDTFDPYNPNYINRLEISDEQFAFVANALNTVPNGYSVIMVGHTSPQNGMMHEDIEYSRAENLRKFLAAYQKKESVTINGNTYDFTSATSKILMYVAGHSHEDMQNYVDGTLYVSVPCDSWNRNRGSMHTYHEYPTIAGKTINEQCFDVCIFDRGNDVADFVRIGWGFNRRFNLNKIELQVGNTLQLTSVFATVSQWLIHDSQGATYDSSIPSSQERWSFTNNVATISSGGLVTALSAGECYAIAIADNGDKEFFYIEVE